MAKVIYSKFLFLFFFSITQEKVSALENQANQLSLQASQECERLAKDRTLTLQMLQKVHISVKLTTGGFRTHAGLR